jgi:hypothetical protein
MPEPLDTIQEQIIQKQHFSKKNIYGIFFIIIQHITK